MSVEITFGIGYGVVIEPEIFEKVEERIQIDQCDFNDLDYWSGRWTRQINAWTGDDYFVGIVYEIADECGAFNIDNSLELNPEHKIEFETFYNKYHLEDFFEWKPERCAVVFCW